MGNAPSAPMPPPHAAGTGGPVQPFTFTSHEPRESVKIDFNALPSLQPDNLNGGYGIQTSGHRHSYSHSSMEQTAHHSAELVVQTSPSASMHGAIECSPHSTPSPGLIRRRLSMKYDGDSGPIDAGVPPPVPAHRVIGGQVVSLPAEVTTARENDSESSPTEKYTRKCSFRSVSSSGSISPSRLSPRSASWSPQRSSSRQTSNTRSRANSRASGKFPGPKPKLEDDSDWPLNTFRDVSPSPPSLESDSSGCDSSSISTRCFALDGYQGTLRVVNTDPPSPPLSPSPMLHPVKFQEKDRFFVPSKAMLAEEAEYERELRWRRRYERYGQPFLSASR